MAARSMSFSAGSRAFKGQRENIRDRDFFSDDEKKDIELPMGMFNQALGDSSSIMSVNEGTSTNGCILSTVRLDKIDDVVNPFYVQHQRFERMSINLRESLTFVSVPKTILQMFKRDVKGSCFRIALCGFIVKPLYIKHATTVRAGIVDFRGVETNTMDSKTKGKVLTTRNAKEMVKFDDTGDKFDWINYVTIPSDKMSFSAVNSNVFFDVKDWNDCKLAIKIPKNIVKERKTAMKIDLLLSIDETDNPQIYELAAVPPSIMADREVKLLKNVQSVMNLIDHNRDNQKIMDQSDELLFDEGERAAHKNAKILKLKSKSDKPDVWL